MMLIPGISITMGQHRQQGPVFENEVVEERRGRAYANKPDNKL